MEITENDFGLALIWFLCSLTVYVAVELTHGLNDMQGGKKVVLCAAGPLVLLVAIGKMVFLAAYSYAPERFKPQKKEKTDDNI